MKKRYKKIILITICTSIPIFLLCYFWLFNESFINNSLQSELSAPNGSITFMVTQSNSLLDFSNIEAFNEIENNLSIDIEFEIINENQLNEKKEIIFASNHYVDAFLTGQFSKEEVLYLSQENKIIALNSLINEYAPILKSFFIDSPYKSDISLLNGNIYALPSNLDTNLSKYPMQMYINSLWLEAIDEDVPKTINELYMTLLKFKNIDLNENNINDEIPLTGYSKNSYTNPLYFILNSYVHTNPEHFLNISGNKLYFVPTTEEWKVGLTFLHRLYNEGLIDIDAFTQNDIQLKTNIDQNKTLDYGCVVTNDLSQIVSTTSSKLRYEFFEPVPPLSSVFKNATTPTSDKFSKFNFMISNKCSKPEIAIQVADYLFSDKGTLSLFGLTDDLSNIKIDSAQSKDDLLIKDYKYQFINKENAKQIYDINNLLFSNLPYDEIVSKIYIGYDMYSSESYLYRMNQILAETYSPYEKLNEYNPSYLKAVFSDEILELKKNILNYVNNNTIAFALGIKDIDKDYDSYIKELYDLGLEQYIDIYRASTLP